MNINNARPLEPEGQLAPPQWTMAVEKNESGYYYAAVARAGQPMCRLSLNHHFETKEDAERALASRVRAWIADYLGRTTSQEAASNDHGEIADGTAESSEQ